MQLCFVKTKFIASKRTMFNSDSKIRSFTSHFSGQIKSYYFRGDRFSSLLNMVLNWCKDLSKKNLSEKMSDYIMNYSHEVRLNFKVNGWYFIQGNISHLVIQPSRWIKTQHSWLKDLNSFSKMNLSPWTGKPHQKTANVLHWSLNWSLVHESQLFKHCNIQKSELINTAITSYT